MSPIIIISRTFYKRDNDIPPVSMKGQKKERNKKEGTADSKDTTRVFFQIRRLNKTKKLYVGFAGFA